LLRIVCQCMCLSFLLTSCSGIKYKNIPSASAYDRVNKLSLDKTPKEVKAIVGQPMMAFFDESKTAYTLGYPEADEEVSMAKAMFDKELGCYFMLFIKNEQGKYIYSPVNFGRATGCHNPGLAKIYDTSLID
jgi:hypothetical protein